MINESIVQDFQRKYLNGERGAMSGLYSECRHITEALAKAYCSRHESDESGIDDTVQVILSRVLSRYRSPSYKIHSFAKVLNIEVVHELSNHKGPKAQLIKGMVSLESIAEPSCKEAEKAISGEDSYFTDILDQSQGSTIILTLYISRSYRAAIRTIESRMGRGWIYDNAVKLHYLWKHMRDGKKRVHGKNRGTSARGDATPDKRNQPSPKAREQTNHGRSGGANAPDVESRGKRQNVNG